MFQLISWLPLIALVFVAVVVFINRRGERQKSNQWKEEASANLGVKKTFKIVIIAFVVFSVILLIAIFVGLLHLQQ